MNDNIKYTSDNKKVVVIGSLNSTEKIVQEIFIVDGAEIPSGEHFVVKSLHDQPVVSWKENQLKIIEDSYIKTKARYESEEQSLLKRYKQQVSLLQGKMEFIGKVLKDADPACFNELVDYLTGKITHIVTFKYSDIQLLEMNEFNQLYDGQLRLVSIYGRADGNFQFKMHQYYDHSGSDISIFLFKSYDEALTKVKELIDVCNINTGIIELATKLSIDIDKDKLVEYYTKRLEEQQKNKSNTLVSIDKINKIIDELNATLSNL